PALGHPDLAGVHFTGSTPVFQSMWKTIGDNIGRYRNYPRIVGETGGKDFIVAHASADVESLATAIVRGSFEYQGQKCSAASRVFAPANLWPELSERLADEVSSLSMGDVTDFSNFMGAVIDRKSFETQKQAIEEARGGDGATGAVVGQQPVGGARASGTNDKAGSMWNLIRWASPRTIKETFDPPTDYRYPFMQPDDGR